MSRDFLRAVQKDCLMSASGTCSCGFVEGGKMDIIQNLPYPLALPNQGAFGHFSVDSKR